MQVTWSLDRRTASWWHCSWLLWWVSGFSAPFPPSAQDWALTQGWSTLPYEARVLGSTGYTESTEPDTTWTQKYYIRIARLQILQQYNVNYLLKIDSARMFFFCTSFDSSRHITSSAVCFNTLQDIPRPNQYKHYTSNLYPTMLNKKNHYSVYDTNSRLHLWNDLQFSLLSIIRSTAVLFLQTWF